MCTIMTTTGSAVTFTEFEEAFAKTKYRGPDDTRVMTAGEGIMGFHRLAIMGLTPEGMQPFEKEG
jgi:asparagine synthase (glutamine-hydrolysing)